MNVGKLSGVYEMDHTQLFDEGIGSRTVCRCQVIAFADGGVVVAFDRGVEEAMVCDVLQCESDSEPTLVKGDVVLVWPGSPEHERGVILGRIGPSRAPAPRPAETPDELLLEAKRSLTLRVGEGSITIREDGKILIKGKDLVSHAQRMNRIKGGAVAIN